MAEYVFRHRRNWKYVRAIPAALRPLYGGRANRIKVFEASGHREALVVGRALAAEDDAAFSRLRRLDDSGREHVISLGGVQATLTEAAETAAAYKQVLDDAAAVRAAPDDLPEVPGYKEAIARTKVVASLPVIYMAPYAKGIAELAAKLEGKALARVSLSSLVDLWVKIKAPREARARERYDKSVIEFASVIGDLEPAQVQQMHAVAYRNWLAEPAQALSVGSQQKRLDHLRSIFNVAVSEGVLASNPVAGIKVRRVAKLVDPRRRKPFSSEQIKAILANLRRLTENVAVKAKRREIEWVVKIAIWHGCRINEVAGLRKEDIRTENGITYLDMNAEHRSLKNGHSIRRVPLHPACKDFVAFAEKAKGPWIFGTLVDYEEGGRAGWIIRNFPAFLKKIGAHGPKLTLHSLRHRWIDAARTAGVPVDVRKAIVGQRAEDGAHGIYGEGLDLQSRAEWMAKVDPTR